MTISQALRQGKKKLKKAGILEYSLDAEVILSQILESGREYLFTHPEETLRRKDRDVFFKKIKKRTQGHPLAYITGVKQFYGLDFYVDKNVLIPRPETELIVDKIRSYVNDQKMDPAGAALLDIGTGSGCLVVTLASQLQKKIDKCFAVDISRSALKVAYTNAKKHNVEQCIKFVHGDLLEPCFKKVKEYQAYEKLIVAANLPYLTPEQYQESFSIKKEPQLALVGGSDGLLFYDNLVHQLKLLKVRIKSSIVLFAEIDPEQKLPFRKLIEREFGECDLQFIKDGGNKWRVAILSV